MQDSAVVMSDTLLLWMLVLLTLTSVQFTWRCHRASLVVIFGRSPASGSALARLVIAASVPALLCGGWIALNPALSDCSWLGTAHRAVASYGLRWFLPDGLARSNTLTANGSWRQKKMCHTCEWGNRAVTL